LVLILNYRTDSQLKLCRIVEMKLSIARKKRASIDRSAELASAIESTTPGYVRDYITSAFTSLQDHTTRWGSPSCRSWARLGLVFLLKWFFFAFSKKSNKQTSRTEYRIIHMIFVNIKSLNVLRFVDIQNTVS